MKKNYKVVIFYIILIAIILVAVFSLFGKSSSSKGITISEVERYFKEDKVYSYNVKEGQTLSLKLYKTAEEGVLSPENAKTLADQNLFETKTYKLYSLSVFMEYCEDYIHTNQNLKPDASDITPVTELPWWVSYIPMLIFAALIIGFWIFSVRQMNGQGGKFASFGKSKAKSNQGKDKKTFADVAGADEEKEELVEIVEFLKDPHKFSRLGARIPHGVLLVGPPGTGKTLLAKAVAGEADVPFFSISGSDFVEMYVGVGASRVRDLFENARKSPAAIIFIDEIDAVGRHRGAGLGGGHDEREQTLNQLLVEMDGFGSHEGIIVMAATNRPDILDPALLRPGRFDRQVTVGLPDIKGREEILKVHSRNKPIENTVDFHKIAQTTIGFSGADLANLMNESALLAAKKGKSLIGMEDIEASFMKLLMGPQKKSKIRTEEDNKLTAFHEAGHAVATYFCKHTDPVKFISIIPAGNAGGVTVSIPETDKMCETKNQMFERIILALGGRVAEELVLDDISTGASSDIQQATKIARAMVTRYGMSKKLGTVLYGSEHTDSEVFLGRDFSSGKSYSEKTASEIDDEIRSIIEEAYQKCREIISLNIDKLNLIANYLLHAEYMDADQFKYAMENEYVTVESLDAIAEEKKRKSEEENAKKLQADKEEDERTKEELRKELEERKRMNDAPFGTTFYDDKDNK